MNLYSVLLVDDEEEVYSVIMKKLDWEAMGFRIAGYARNGVEALEMAEEIQPDVVMTDIKMPYMDGLTLSKKLKELYQKIKIIIFSGFDEFEYAKEAIKICGKCLSVSGQTLTESLMKNVISKNCALIIWRVFRYCRKTFIHH